ncbi:MAG: polysaccharide biosynthesis C-terminal domain-containing protein [Planctomycetota bacterium]
MARFVPGLRGDFCRLMTDQQLGQWSMVWSFLMMLAPLAVLGLPGCFGRFVEHYRHEGQLRTFVMRVSAVSCLVTLCLTATIFLFPESWSWLVFRESTHTSIVMWVGFSLIFVTAMNFLMSLMEALRQIRLVTVMRFILGTAFFAVGCSLMLVWKDMTAAATAGFGIGCIAASIPAAWFIWKFRGAFVDSGNRLSHMNMWSRIAPFALWMWWSNLCYNLFEVADRYMLIHWSPVEASVAQSSVGQYHSGRVLPLLLVGVSVVLGGLLMPYMSAAWVKGEHRKAQNQLTWTIKLTGLSFTIAGFACLLLAPFLFNTFLEGRYNDGLAVLPLTMVYCIWMSLSTVGQDYMWVAEKGKYVLAAVSSSLVLNITLNMLLIPTMGMWGAVIATTAANAVNLVLIYGCNHRIGCRTDAGVWTTAILPLSLLLPQIVIVFVLATVAIVAIRTNWIFNPEEKSRLGNLLNDVRGKLGI